MTTRSMLSTLNKLREEGKLEKLTSGKSDNSGTQEIDILKVVPDPEQPRRVFNDETLKSLADSISVHGVLQPITVQFANDEGVHLIIMGERRWRAAQIAGLTTIPAIIREVTSELRSIQMTENIHREDLTTMEIAQAVEELRGAGMKRPEIAKTLGWSEPEVSRFSGVMSMPDELKQLARNNVPVRALSDLNAIWKKNEEQARAFVAGTNPADITRVSVAELRSAIESNTQKELDASRIEANAPISSPAPDRERKQQSQKPQHATSGNGVAIICKCGDEIGRILTNQKASTNKALMVSFENGDRIEEKALAEIELIEVIDL